MVHSWQAKRAKDTISQIVNDFTPNSSLCLDCAAKFLIFGQNQLLCP